MMVEEWWSFVKKEVRSLHKYTRVAKHDRSGAGEEGYTAINAECEGSERDETQLLRPLCCTV